MATAAGISTTTVSTDQLAPLGFVLTVPDYSSDYGQQEWVYVKTSAELTKGLAAERANTTPFVVGVGAAATTRASCVGVAQHTIASGSYGFILRKGVGTVLADGSVTAGSDITCAGSGKVTDMVDGFEEGVIGMSFAADAGSGADDFVLAILDCGA